VHQVAITPTRLPLVYPYPELRGVILAAKLSALADDFAPIDDLQERLSLLLDRARRTPPLPPTDRTETHRVLGCISAVWLTAELQPDGLLAFHADADSPLVRGLVVSLADFFSGATAAEIAASDADPLAALELLANLSPTRRNGLTAVRQRIRTLAHLHLA
jgi:cysteine desulfuration protein SufE